MTGYQSKKKAALDEEGIYLVHHTKRKDYQGKEHMSIEAMKQALEALEYIENNYMSLPKVGIEAITSLRQAIEQAERQETNQVTLTQTNVGIGERGMEAYEAAKKRGWVGLSDERLMEMPKQEPVAFNAGVPPLYPEMKDGETISVKYLETTPQPQRERVVFPTMLRKMWSGGEVQAWLDENVNKEKNT